MLLSRFWYVVLGLVLGSAVFVLFLAQSMYNRQGDRARGMGLSSDSQVVSWYLKDDARTRAGHLIKFALDQDVSSVLRKSTALKAKEEDREKAKKALAKVNATIAKEDAFDAVFAVDQNGSVVAHLGYPQANGMKGFELGGYSVVADALHGFIRDDTLVLDRIYRVVARPVQAQAGERPAGAIVGARVLDDKFARELSKRTGAAVAFYVNGSRQASGAPEGFAKANLDQIVSDLEALDEDKDYTEIGRSGIREVGNMLTVQYTRLPGEAYTLGAGFAVAREMSKLSSPLDFFNMADDKDKESANLPLVGGLAAAAIFLGLIFSILEHTIPLRAFKSEAMKLSEGGSDQLQPSKFRGAYRKIAAELNDGIDKVAASSGGQSRKAANLEDVLGDLPAQPQMAAFGLPGADAPASASPAVASPAPPSAGGPPAPPARGLPTPPGTAPAAADPEAGWQEVYNQFVATKQQCGENVEGFTYEKFRKTLVKNRDALVARHGATGVKFSVYVKEGKAALKASPLKG